MTNPQGSSAAPQGGWGQSAPQPPASQGQGVWGQPAPMENTGGWGQQSAQDNPYSTGSYATGSPSAGGYGQGSPSAGGYGTGGPLPYSAPPKKRGIIRIVIGALLLFVVAPIGLFIGAFAGAGLGVWSALTSIESDDVTTLRNGETVAVSGTSIYLVGSTDASATCTVEGGPGTEIDYSPGSTSGITFDKDGVGYTSMGQLTSSADTQVAITCTGGDVAVAKMGVGSTLIGLAIGIGIPLLLGLLGLILLISGIVGLIRSSRGQ